MNTSKSNRDALASVVRVEIERALGRLGLAREREVEALQTRLRDLEAQVRELRSALPAATASAPPAPKRAAARGARASTTKRRTSRQGKPDE